MGVSHPQLRMVLDTLLFDGRAMWNTAVYCALSILRVRMDGLGLQGLAETLFFHAVGSHHGTTWRDMGRFVKKVSRA